MGHLNKETEPNHPIENLELLPPIPPISYFLLNNIPPPCHIDGCEEDAKVKNAMYVEKNIDLNQEFYFAHSDAKLAINKIYNSHFSGSPLWDLFGIGARNI